MNDQLLDTMMQALDPARDLTDETIDELFPAERLSKRLVAAIASEPASSRPHLSMWRRVPVRIVAGAAAVTLAVSGAVTLFGATPGFMQATALRATDNGEHYGPIAKVPGPDAFSTSMVLSKGVRNDRFVDTVQLDGGTLSVSPAPASMKTPSNAAAVETEIWATSQLQGYSKWRPNKTSTSFGYGIVTLTRNEGGIQVITKQAAWVGLARGNTRYHCPLETGTPSTKELLRHAPSNGLAAVVVGEPSGSPALVYIAKSVHCGRLYPAVVENASEQYSLAWHVVAGIGTSRLTLEVSPPPCGELAGSAVAATTKDGSLSSLTINEYGTVPDATLSYQACPEPTPVRVVIEPGGRTTSATKLIHPMTGPMKVVARSFK